MDTPEESFLHDLEPRLSRGTRLPAGRLDAMRGWTETDLRRHTAAVMRMIVDMADAVAAARENPHTSNSFFESLDLRLISRDHGWRAVFAALKDLGQPHTEHQALALRKYLRYLRSRKEAIDTVRSARRDLADTDEFNESTWPFDDDGIEFVRVPPGETVEIRLNYRDRLHLRLGVHVFVLRDGYPPTLVDPKDREITLRYGRQCVGRHPENDVVIHARFAQVSRVHMLLDWPGSDLLYVTDLSSLGTFVEYQPAH